MIQNTVFKIKIQTPNRKNTEGAVFAKKQKAVRLQNESYRLLF